MSVLRRSVAIQSRLVRALTAGGRDMAFGIQQGPLNGGLPQYTPISHRSAVIAADVVAVPGTVTCTKQAGGSATAGTYNVKVVAVNAFGRTTPKTGNTTITTET